MFLRTSIHSLLEEVIDERCQAVHEQYGKDTPSGYWPQIPL